MTSLSVAAGGGGGGGGGAETGDVSRVQSDGSAAPTSTPTPTATPTPTGGAAFRPELMVADPHCYECKVRYRDPKPSDLVMYLHALKYAVSGGA